jgi:hypothetical protein
MKWIRNLLYGTTLLLVVSSCKSAPGELSLLEKSYPSAEITTISIMMDRGSILVTESNDTQTHLQIRSHPGTNPIIHQDDDHLVVDLPNSKTEDRIEIQLAGDPGLDIQTFGSSIELISPAGELMIRNTAGDILLEDYQGPTAVLWAGRGNITIQNGQGKLVLTGEHGTLHIINFDGQVAAATIMGEIQYSGTHQNTADVILEADHGPIHASIPSTSSYQIEISSASGNIVCTGTDLKKNSEGCQGSIEDGRGKFNIRTVSGRIEFQITDSMQDIEQD